MRESTLIDLSRMMALRTKLDVAANNVANLETAGFRAQQLSFQEYLAPVKDQEVGAKRERPLSLVDATLAFTSSAAGAIVALQQRRNFVAPLAGEYNELNNYAEHAADLAGRVPNGLQFVVC